MVLKPNKTFRYQGAHIAINNTDEKEATLTIKQTTQMMKNITARKLLPHIMAEALNSLIISKLLFYFQHTIYNKKQLKELNKFFAHHIKTKTGSFPFPTDKVHLQTKLGGWGLLNLKQMYKRNSTSTLIDRIFKRKTKINSNRSN